MLSLFRTQTGNYIVGAIVVGIIVVFALEFRTGRGNPTARLKTECAVQYAGNCVDQKDFFAAYGLAARGLDPKAAREMAMKKKVLDGLAERELLVAEASRLGMAVSDGVLDTELTSGRALVSLPAALSEMLSFRLGLCRREMSSYHCEPGTPLGVRQLQVTRTEGEPFDYKLYEKEIRILANRGPKEFRAAQERELLAETLRNVVRQRARISDSEAFAIFDRGRSRAVVRSVVLDRSWFAHFAIDTSEGAVEKWAAGNASQLDAAVKADKDLYTVGCPLVSELSIPLPENAVDTEKSDARAKLDALRARLAKGEPFEAVAREASSAASAPFGGKVGCLNTSHGPGSEALLEATKKLAPAQLSDVIETPRALYLLRLDGKLDAATLDRDARAQTARTLYLTFAADQSLRAFASELVRQTKAGAKLEDVTRALSEELARRAAPKAAIGKDAGLPPGLLAADRPRFEVSPPFTASGNPLPDLEPREPLATRAFALSTPDQLDEHPVETATGLVILQLKEKTPASREDFEKEKWALLRMLQQTKANEAVTRYIADLKHRAGSKLKVDARFAQETKAESADD